MDSDPDPLLVLELINFIKIAQNASKPRLRQIAENHFGRDIKVSNDLDVAIAEVEKRGRDFGIEFKHGFFRYSGEPRRPVQYLRMNVCAKCALQKKERYHPQQAKPKCFNICKGGTPVIIDNQAEQLPVMVNDLRRNFMMAKTIARLCNYISSHELTNVEINVLLQDVWPIIPLRLNTQESYVILHQLLLLASQLVSSHIVNNDGVMAVMDRFHYLAHLNDVPITEALCHFCEICVESRLLDSLVREMLHIILFISDNKVESVTQSKIEVISAVLKNNVYMTPDIVSEVYQYLALQLEQGQCSASALDVLKMGIRGPFDPHFECLWDLCKLLETDDPKIAEATLRCMIACIDKKKDLLFLPTVMERLLYMIRSENSVCQELSMKIILKLANHDLEMATMLVNCRCEQIIKEQHVNVSEQLKLLYYKTLNAISAHSRPLLLPLVRSEDDLQRVVTAAIGPEMLVNLISSLRNTLKYTRNAIERKEVKLAIYSSGIHKHAQMQQPANVEVQVGLIMLNFDLDAVS